MAKTCYACDRPKQSKEHVPPAGLFPERKDTNGRDLRVNLITVPSCDEHNQDKSEDDLYLLGVFSTNVCTNSVGLQQAATKLLRTFRERPKLFEQMFPSAKEVTVTDSATGANHKTVMVDLDGPRFERTMRLIALGLYYKEFKKRWTGPVHVVADFVDQADDVDYAKIAAERRSFFESTSALFATVPPKGANPDVFMYRVIREGDNIAMRLTFYGGCTATAMFSELLPKNSPAEQSRGVAPSRGSIAADDEGVREKQARRRAFLNELHAQTGGNPKIIGPASDIADALKLPHDEATEIAWHLHREGLVQVLNRRPDISITHAGVTAVEEVRVPKDQPKSAKKRARSFFAEVGTKTLVTLLVTAVLALLAWLWGG